MQIFSKKKKKKLTILNINIIKTSNKKFANMKKLKYKQKSKLQYQKRKVFNLFTKVS